MKPRNAMLLLGSILLCEIAGLIGAIFTTPSIPAWYASLVKPGFSPPNWLFAPVWTLLYLLMGVSLYLIITAKSKKKKAAYYLFAVQLALNVLWSILFFGMHAPLYAFMEIVLMWISILATILVFHRISKPAAWLNVPYLLWVAFASALNLAIFILN